MNKRNYGIDLLKIVSMAMVVLLHVLNYGGITTNAAVNSVQYYAAWFMESFAYICVDCFGMISGYLGWNRSFHYSSLVERWLQVVFYTFFSALIFFIAGRCSITDVLNGLTPVRMNAYWYFTQYFGLCFFIPFLNIMFRQLNQKQSRNLVLSITLVLSLYPVLIKYDAFSLNQGYSLAWLICLYLLGAYVNRYGIFSKMKISTGWLLILICTLISFFSGIRYFQTPEGIEKPMMFLTYTSPTVLLSSVIMLKLSSSLEVKSVYLQKLLATWSSLSFGVYLLNDCSWLRNTFLMNRLTFLATDSAVMLVLCTLVCVIIVYLCGTFVDWIRNLFFKICHIKNFSKWLCSLLGNYVLDS